ncbi:MAG TPA: hypothetical protein VFO94_18630, partial [Gammaproteobacteria bacterium]|nr:hypothetical protein [Gammaproteobacteria bacterium]
MSSTTITIRANQALRDALVKRARAEHKTVSHVVREILEDSLVERPLGERLGKLRGNLRVAEPAGSWQREIRKRNWRA